MIESARLGLYHRHAGRNYQHISAQEQHVSVGLAEDQIRCSAITQPKNDLVPKPEDLPRRTMAYLLIRPGDIRNVNPVAMLSSLRRACPGSITHLSDCLDGREPFAQLFLLTGSLNIAICREIQNGTISLQVYEREATDRSSCDKWKIHFDKVEFDKFLKKFEYYWHDVNREKVKARGDSHIRLFKSIDRGLEL